MNFGRVRQALGGVPAILLNEKDRKRLGQRQALAQALTMALGGAAARLDLNENGLALSVRTVHIVSSGNGEQ